MGVIAAAVTSAVTAIGSAFAGAGAAIAGGLGLGEAALGGVSAGSLIGGGLEGATIGALGGGGLSAIEGKPILPGLAEGALVGGVTGGLGPAVSGALGGGIAGTAADVALGAGAGALGGAAIPGAGGAESGALGGATAGLISGLSAPGAAGGTTAPVGGPGTSAAGIAAPASIGDTGSYLGPPSDAAGGAVNAPGGGAAYGPTSDFGGAPAGGASGAVAGNSLSTLTDPLTTGLDISPSPGANFGGTAVSGTPYAGATTASNPADIAQAQAGTYPLPPVPPSLDASGNPLDSYPTLGAAQAAVNANAADVGGGVTPQASGVAGLTQGLGLNGPTAGTYGYEINPAAGTNPTAPAGAGPGGTYTLAQGATANAPAAGAGNSFQQFLSDPGFGTAANIVTSNPGLALGAATVGLDLLRGDQPPKGEAQISGIANQLGTQAGQLQSYLTSGTLPPGVSTALQQASSAAQASIKSQYAARGMTGSSAEAQDLANVQNTIVAQGAQIATQLLNTGIQENNLAAELYGQIMQTSLTQDQQLSNALATLASSAVRPTITLGTTSG